MRTEAPGTASTPGSPRTEPAGMVVGAGASLEAEVARRWALGEARLRAVPLTLLRACGSTPDEATAAVSLLRAAASRCRQEAPDVPVRMLVTPGSPADALARSGADLVVVGAPDVRRLDLVRGSVGAAVAARGRVPVVVARGDHGRDEAPDWPVLAAVRIPDDWLHDDRADDCDPPAGADDVAAVLELAGRAAQREGRPLVVVNAHQPLGVGVRRLRRLRRVADRCEQRFPGVRVRVELADDAPDRAVLERTAHAALVVVGVRRLRPGAVGRLLERLPPVLPVGVPLEVATTWRSRCPVLLAPPAAVAPARAPAGSVSRPDREERR